MVAELVSGGGQVHALDLLLPEAGPHLRAVGSHWGEQQCGPLFSELPPDAEWREGSQGGGRAEEVLGEAEQGAVAPAPSSALGPWGSPASMHPPGYVFAPTFQAKLASLVQKCRERNHVIDPALTPPAPHRLQNQV